MASRLSMLLDMSASKSSRPTGIVHPPAAVCMLFLIGDVASVPKSFKNMLRWDSHIAWGGQGQVGDGVVVVSAIADSLNCRLDERGSFLATLLDQDYSSYAATIPIAKRDASLVGAVHVHHRRQAAQEERWVAVSGVFPAYDFTQKCVEQYRATVAQVIAAAWQSCEAMLKASRSKGHNRRGAVGRLVLPLLGTAPPLSFPTVFASQIILEAANAFVLQLRSAAEEKKGQQEELSGDADDVAMDALEVVVIDTPDSCNAFKNTLTTYWSDHASSLSPSIPAIRVSLSSPPGSSPSASRQGGGEDEPIPENETPKERRARERRVAERAFQVRQAQQLQNQK